MARRVCFEVRDLAFHPDRGETGFQRFPDGAGELRDCQRTAFGLIKKGREKRLTHRKEKDAGWNPKSKQLGSGVHCSHWAQYIFHISLFIFQFSF